MNNHQNTLFHPFSNFIKTRLIPTGTGFNKITQSAKPVILLIIPIYAKILISFLLLILSTAPMAEVDPFEGANRAIDTFNQVLDEAILEPVAIAYKNTIPKGVRNRVRDFSANLGDIVTFTNEVAQFKFLDSTKTLGRVLINSTIGIVGLFDVAHGIGLVKTSEDFGQTMAVWGVPSGPYVVLPLLGPSTLRDSVGRAADIVQNNYIIKDLSSEQDLALTLMRGIDIRTILLPVTDLLKKADDPYIATRSAYLQKRQFDIYDGDLPIQDDEF